VEASNHELGHQPCDRTGRPGDRLAARRAPSGIDAIIERTGKGTGPGNDERIETPKVQIDEQLASLWAYFTLTRPGDTRIDVCGVNLFLLRKGPDGWKIFQIAATSRTEGCRRS
jgi:hypothetical protein